MRRICLILIINLIILSSQALPEEINPYSYRNDFYKMPVQNEVQEKALLKYKLNWVSPQIALDYPVLITDREGNKTVLQGGKQRFSVSRDGEITYFANRTKTHSKKILSDGSLNLFRKYTRHSPLVEITNEFGQTVGYESLGLDNKVLARFDAFKRPLYKYEYDDSGYWEYNFVNNIWKRYEKELPVEERRGSKDGELIAYWVKGEFFDKSGLWRIEKGWDGEKITDLFYTRYDEFGKEDYETYRDGYLVRRKFWENHRLVLVEDLTEFTYTKYGEFGLTEGGEIWEDRQCLRWEYRYQGSRLTEAVRWYNDLDYYDERIYDINGNIDKVVRISKESGEILCVLEDRAYFNEEESLSKEELKSFFDIDDETAQSIYDWIQKMKSKGKGRASLFGILDFVTFKLTLYEENNLPLATILLKSPSYLPPLEE